MKISFTGCIPPYKTQKAEIYPIEKDISSSEINAVCNEIEKYPKYLGEGVNGCAYSLGRDLVIKKCKNNALVNQDVMNEAKKLDMIYDFQNETGYDLGNTQRGIAAFKLHNGSSYLLSTLVNGNKADTIKNPLNKKNLFSLISILTALDKGSSKYGRLMVNDLNLSNIHFTKTKAGVLDFEHMQGYKPDESIKKVVLNKEYGVSAHTSDTSNLDSNIRSFEFAGLYYYLEDLEQKEAKKLFEDYLSIKSIYHKEMSQYYQQQISKSLYPEILENIAESEKAHFKLLSSKKISDDILKAEAVKIQMSNFTFISSKWCNASYIKFNPRQIINYYKNGLRYFENEFKKAVKNKDEYRMIYYKDCINLFNKWDKIQSLPNNMNEIQKSRITAESIKTLDMRVY